MHRSYCGQIRLDTLWGLEAANDPQPDSEQAQVVAGEREFRDVCFFCEFEEGLLLGVQSFASATGPRHRLEDPHMTPQV